MRARCGACGSVVEVIGGDRFECPACGRVNQLPPAPGAPRMEPTGGMPPSADPMPGTPPSAPPEPPAPRMRCPACSFGFIVGADAATVICPNCRAEIDREDD